MAELAHRHSRLLSPVFQQLRRRRASVASKGMSYQRQCGPSGKKAHRFERVPSAPRSHRCGGVKRKFTIPVLEVGAAIQRLRHGIPMVEFGYPPPFGVDRVLPPARQPVQQPEVRQHFGFLMAIGCQPLHEFPIAWRELLLFMGCPGREFDTTSLQGFHLFSPCAGRTK